MKKNTKIFIGIAIVAILALGITYAAWPKGLRGKYETESGFIYCFGDGVVALDTISTPNQFLIYAAPPEGWRTVKAELVEEGLRVDGMVTGRLEVTSSRKSDEIDTVSKETTEVLSTGSMGVTVHRNSIMPGKVHVLESQGGVRFESKYLAINQQAIQDFIDHADWDASVREIWKK